MVAPQLARYTSHGVTLLGDTNRPGGVTLAFTERTGGVSQGSYASLNLGDACGDDPRLVARNRARALAALGAAGLEERLVCPKQVHGDRVLVVDRGRDNLNEVRSHAREGADAVVCLAANVPVLLCSADCVPVILCAPQAFAVVHSGWRGTLARIAGKALRELVRASNCAVGDVRAYVGPHIGPADYEVSPQLATNFRRAFGEEVVCGSTYLDLGAAVEKTLVEEGLGVSCIAHVKESTASHTDRFFSYRAEGVCGRHGALACRLQNVGQEGSRQ